ncbi:uncharacterized protein CLUP02_03947 [Colletotrichum lupini]|uniref:Uncharacterized protein n=1 Tax=Colletotrichum lupini TaxID=145971 RepID=A0A9Q8WDB4_9PEZI|nr:uncharacterized protein CLUP02_03947 [Colletotrichum lupini]UQC78470.1 hypothetical protein CLUP02_03947 [Colletotrichum lupini]
MASPALNSRRPPSGYSTNVVIRANHIDSTTPVRSRGTEMGTMGPFIGQDSLGKHGMPGMDTEDTKRGRGLSLGRVPLDDDEDDDDGYDNDGTSQRDPWTLLHQIQTWTG